MRSWLRSSQRSGRGSGTRAAGIGMVAAIIATLAGTPPGQADPGEYGKNDAGGFRNVLPAGQDGVANSADLATFLRTGEPPQHWADQQPLYERLLYASPTLTDRQIPSYFKDATFGVRPGDVASVIRPRAGLTIVRDKSYGVPHIYGSTRSATMFGAGYAGATDRLFLMDALRHAGRARLSSFLGGSNLSADEDQWRFAPYTEADLRRQLRLTAQANGAAGRRAVADVASYVAGVNAYIAAARKDSTLMPVEYGLIGQQLQRWRATDVIATASMIGGIFGRGGGGELDSALVLQALEQRFGKVQGRRIWSGFRSRNDPEAPTTIAGRFPYQTGDPFASRGLALPAPGSVVPARVVETDSAPASESGSQFGAALRESLARAHASNWELVSARRSRTGRPLAVMGPQVGYSIPQVLMEMDLHGPGIDARGVAFPGVNMYVQMGHGRDYAWSATSAGSDNVDTFAEVLCGGDRVHYRYRGRCRPMERLRQDNAWKPNAIDDTAAGSAELTSYRTVHGIVTAYGRSRGKRVAYVTSRSTYFHEGDSILGFQRLNDPRYVKSPQDFQRAASAINFTFNWAYVDARHIAYYLSGAYPQRAPGTSPDFPVLGTGRFDWQGFDPKTRAAKYLGFAQHPNAVDPDFLVSWNNKPAQDWSAADEQWGYGPLYRSQLISDRIRSDLRGGRSMRLSDLVQAMSEPATQDVRGVKLLPLLLRQLGTPSDPQLRSAVVQLRRWQASGSHRRDLDRDGTYEHDRAVQIMDAWWAKLVTAQFRPVLGAQAFEAVQQMIGFGGPAVGSSPGPDQFSDGWWGYAHKDLRTVFTPRSVQGVYARAFCGNGDPQRCRAVLRGTLAQALTVGAKELYGFGACADDPQPLCFDRNRWRVISAIRSPAAFPFQNRPTFQQVVSIPRSR